MKLVVLPGDGIGPEVAREAVRVLKTVGETFDFSVHISEHLIGGVAIRDAGSPFPDKTREACVAADAVLLGAVGDPEFDHLTPDKRPEKGLLALRKALGGFANLRPFRPLPEWTKSTPGPNQGPLRRS